MKFLHLSSMTKRESEDLVGKICRQAWELALKCTNFEIEFKQILPKSLKTASKKDLMKLIEYRKAVKKAKELKIEIKNPSIEHAGILMDELLTHAIENKLDIKLVSGRLEKNFYDSLMPKFEDAVKAGCKVDVLVGCGESSKIENKALYKLLNNPGRASAHYIEDKSIIHFMLAGDSAYRVEINKEYKTAIGHFDNTTIGEVLSKKFEEYAKNKTTNYF